MIPIFLSTQMKRMTCILKMSKHQRQTHGEGQRKIKLSSLLLRQLTNVNLWALHELFFWPRHPMFVWLSKLKTLSHPAGLSAKYTSFWVKQSNPESSLISICAGKLKKNIFDLGLWLFFAASNEDLCHMLLMEFKLWEHVRPDVTANETLAKVKINFIYNFNKLLIKLSILVTFEINQIFKNVNLMRAWNV